MDITTEFGKLNITRPKRVLMILDAMVPARKKSRFITAAIEEKLAKERRENAFAALLQAPPTLTEIDNPVAWVDELRRADEERLQALGL
jgi:hypothetical protein